MDKVLSALQVVRLPPGRNVRGSLLICPSPDGLNVHITENPKEEFHMEILNTVIALLQLLATVILGTIQATRICSRDIFRERPKAKHYSKAKK